MSFLKFFSKILIKLKVKQIFEQFKKTGLIGLLKKIIKVSILTLWPWAHHSSNVATFSPKFKGKKPLTLNLQEKTFNPKFTGKNPTLRPNGAYPAHHSKNTMFPLDDEGYYAADMESHYTEVGS